MRDTIIIAGICLVSIAIGVALYFVGPKDLAAPVREEEQSVQEAAVAVSTSDEVLGNIPFTVLDKGVNAAEATARKNYVVSGEAEYARLWKMANGDTSAMPPVDFSKDYVIAVFAGMKNSGGHTITIDSVTATAEERTVSVSLTEPGRLCVVTDALTSPYELIRLPHSALPLTHTDSIEVTDCRE